jgi:hypothetical protein
MSLAVAPLASGKKGAATISRLFDFAGFGILTETLQSTLHTDSVSIGISDYDRAKPLFVFHGLEPSATALAWRVAATFAPLILVAVAALFFHRFDPARVKTTGMHDRQILNRLSMLFKPFSRMLFAIAVRPGKATRLRAFIADAMLTLSSMPVAVVALVVFAVLSLVTPVAGLRGLLPALFVAYAIVIADVACRETRAGTNALLFSAPRIRESIVPWKAAVTIFLGVVFFGVVIVRIGMTNPVSALALMVGIAFVGAAATLLATVSGTPKTFVLLFMMLMYAVVNDHGATSSLNFAGFGGSVNTRVMAGYAIAAAASLIAAHVWSRRSVA